MSVIPSLSRLSCGGRGASSLHGWAALGPSGPGVPRGASGFYAPTSLVPGPHAHGSTGSSQESPTGGKELSESAACSSAVLPTGLVEETDELLGRWFILLLNLTTLINLMCHLLPERIFLIVLSSWALLQPRVEHLTDNN